jgi:putative heme-binding domain-containing protein
MQATSLRFWVFVCLIVVSGATPGRSQSLDEELRQMRPADLAGMAKRNGDAVRGAVVFFQHHMACSKCHSVGDAKPSALGPDLATLGKEATDESLVESVLLPSKVIRKGFESVTIVTGDGKSITGLVVERSQGKIVVRDVGRLGELATFLEKDLDEVKANSLSIMPVGQVNQF